MGITDGVGILRPSGPDVLDLMDDQILASWVSTHWMRSVCCGD